MKVNTTLSIDTLITEFVEEYNKGNNDFLLFDLAHANENSHTKVLLSLLKYNNSYFLPSFIERLGLPKSIEHKYNDIEVDDQKVAISEITTGKAKGYIDLYLRYKDENCKYVHVIVENKIYGAGDTKRQLARYIATVEGVNPKTFGKWYGNPIINSDIYVLYLTADGTKEPQKDSLPDIIKNCLGEKYIPINYQDNILPWLEEDVLPNIPFSKDGIMIAGIRQYIAYLYSMRKEKVSPLSETYFQSLKGLGDVDKYREIQKNIEHIEKKMGKDNKDTILQSLKRELSVKAESIFMNDVEGVGGDWKLHFTPTFIFLYRQRWADLDNRKYSIPSFYLQTSTKKFLKAKGIRWKVQVDHLDNKKRNENEKNKPFKLGNYDRTAYYEIKDDNLYNDLYVVVNDLNSRKNYYLGLIKNMEDYISKVNEVVEAIRKEPPTDKTFQEYALEKLAEKLSNKKNIFYFESDEEFIDFCLAPYAIVKRSADGTLSVEGQYSEMYKKYIEEGKTFIIKDEDSQVFKHQCVRKRVPVQGTGRSATVQLPVQNLEQYFEDLEDE